MSTNDTDQNVSEHNRSSSASGNDTVEIRMMRSAVCTSPGNFRIRKSPVAEPGEGEVLVRLEGCGVCGSNIPIWEGRPWFRYPLDPGAPGHEGWGRIECVGPSVTNVKRGDRVAMLSQHAYAEYDTVLANSLVVLPSELDNVSFPGEPLGCAMNIIERSDIREEHTVAVIGIGFLGAVLTRLAAHAGARVIALSRRRYALDIAAQFGAAEVIEMRDHQEIIARINSLTDGEGCDRVIEAVGEQWPLDLASEMTRIRGKLIVAGYHQDGLRTVNMQLWNWRGLDVINAHERDASQYIRGIESAVRAVADGILDPSLLFTHEFTLDSMADAFFTMQRRPDGFIKATIKL